MTEDIEIIREALESDLAHEALDRIVERLEKLEERVIPEIPAGMRLYWLGKFECEENYYAEMCSMSDSVRYICTGTGKNLPDAVLDGISKISNVKDKIDDKP